jgi:hypothetical protein
LYQLELERCDFDCYPPKNSNTHASLISHHVT